MFLPFTDFNPDAGPLDPTSSDAITNVLPASNGYLPQQDLAAVSAALGSRCRGGAIAVTSTGAYKVFAATAADLFELNNTDQTWTNRSKSAGAYSLGADETWSFQQFGNNLVATHIGDPVQVIDLDSGTAFADLAGSPPQARYAAAIGDHLALGATNASEAEIWLSGRNDIEAWTVGRKGCDTQVLPDGGGVTGLAGFQRGGLVFQERRIRLLTLTPSAQFTFSLEEMKPFRGAIAGHSIVTVGEDVVYFSEEGFFAALGLSQSGKDIGTERVNRYVLGDIDLGSITDVQGAADPTYPRVYWRYKSVNSSGDYSDKIIVYDMVLNRWSRINKDTHLLLSAASGGYTLEELGSAGLGYTLETLPLSLDSSAWKGGRPAFGAFDSDNKLGFWDGDNMEATIETADMPVAGPGLRALVRGFRPVVDTTTTFGQVAKTNVIGDTRTWNDEAAQSAATGRIPAHVSGRRHRFRVRIPAATTWTRAMGIETDAKPLGKR